MKERERIVDSLCKSYRDYLIQHSSTLIRNVSSIDGAVKMLQDILGNTTESVSDLLKLLDEDVKAKYDNLVEEYGRTKNTIRANLDESKFDTTDIETVVDQSMSDIKGILDGKFAEYNKLISV